MPFKWQEIQKDSVHLEDYHVLVVGLKTYGKKQLRQVYGDSGKHVLQPEQKTHFPVDESE